MTTTEPPKVALKVWPWLIAITVGVIALLIATKPEPKADLQEQKPVRVTLERAEKISLSPTETVVGRLMPVKRATLRFEVSGQLAQRLVEPGALVIAGQPLLQLKEADYRELYEEAIAQYRLEEASIGRDRILLTLAEKNVELQRNEVKRLEDLGAQSLSSRSQLDAAQQKLLQLEAEESQLRHSVRTTSSRLALQNSRRERARRQLERTVLRAPFDGTVNRVNVDIGDYITANQAVLELVDTAELNLHVHVPGNTAAGLQLGQKLQVIIGTREVTGMLYALQTDPDTSTYTHALHIRISGQTSRPGALAAVELPLTPLEEVLAVPVSAVLRSEGNTFVFRYEDGALSKVPVVPGIRVEGIQVINEGINVGDRIVAQDVAALRDGQPVEVDPEALL